MVEEHVVDAVEKIIEWLTSQGAAFADARIQRYTYEYVDAEDGEVRDHYETSRVGVGFRVIVGSGIGYSSTTVLEEAGLREAAERALRAARALDRGGSLELAGAPVKGRASSHYIRDPLTVDPREKEEIVKDATRTALSLEGIASARARLGFQVDERIVLTSDGGLARSRVVLVGFGVTVYARGPSGVEAIGDSESRVAGYEFIMGEDWSEYSLDVARWARVSSRSRRPRPGSYRVLLDPGMVGLLLHEALGHASEGDLVSSGASVIAGRLGERIGSPLVTIIDSGSVEGGYYVPFDDEGIEKRDTVIVEGGILKGYLADRVSGARLGLEPTGNGRVQSYGDPVLVRQTNYYMKPGDYSIEELLEELGDGLYLSSRGSRGGEVDTGNGVFTFTTGVVWRVERGRLVEPLRSTTISGDILGVLSRVEAVGRDLKVNTSVFGGCGKSGQLVRVGDGGPHVLVSSIIVGGE